MGIFGFMAIESWNFFDSLYMVVITLATIGYGETHPLSAHGRMFNIAFIVIGVAIIAYTIDVFLTLFIEGHIGELIGKTRMEKKINNLNNHYIICGYGRMGKIIYKDLQSKGIQAVAIEEQTNSADYDDTLLIIKGSATNDEILIKAGIMKAKGVITVLTSDADNLFVVLSARSLNPSIEIIARGEDRNTEKKLIWAGANRVVSPYQEGGFKIVMSIVNPGVVHFVDFALKDQDLGLKMDELLIRKGSKLDGITIGKAGLDRMDGILLVAVIQADTFINFKPSYTTVLNAGDVLIFFCERNKLDEIETLKTA
ncbi:TrkA-N domain-containing protein [Candidatus Magnetoovum chiemensis]|nr:TrkA-N domain-containing protein [Candidatus Magnetoovum chiemensis]